MDNYLLFADILEAKLFEFLKTSHDILHLLMGRTVFPEFDCPCINSLEKIMFTKATQFSEHQ